MLINNRNNNFSRGKKQNQNYQNPKKCKIEWCYKHLHPTDSYVNTQPQPKAQIIINLDENNFLDDYSDSHSRKLKILIGTEQTACYFETGIYPYKKELRLVIILLVSHTTIMLQPSGKTCFL